MRRSSVVAIVVLLFLGGAAALTLRSHPTDGLPAVAEAAWRSRNVYMVSGQVRTEPAYAEWFAAERPGLDDRRRALGGDGIAYVSERTTLGEVRDVSARRDTARVRVRIESVLGMRGPEGGPPETSGSEELEFRFHWERGGWVLREVREFGRG